MLFDCWASRGLFPWEVPGGPGAAWYWGRELMLSDADNLSLLVSKSGSVIATFQGSRRGK